MSYAPAIRGCWQPLQAAASQAFSHLCASADQLVAASRCEQISTAPKARLAAKQYLQLARRYYDDCAAYNTELQTLLLGVIAETKRAQVRLQLARKHRCDYLRAARVKQQQQASDDLRVWRETDTREQLRQQSERTTTRELCARRRAAVVGVAAPCAPPAVMVSNYSGVATAM